MGHFLIPKITKISAKEMVSIYNISHTIDHDIYTWFMHSGSDHWIFFTSINNILEQVGSESMHNGSASSWREEPLLIGCARHVRIQNHPQKPWFRQAKDFLILMIFYATHDLALSFSFHVVLLQKVCTELTWKRLLANKYASTECINDFITYSLFSYIIILTSYTLYYLYFTSHPWKRERGI
jgi:hypothetical protein